MRVRYSPVIPSVIIGVMIITAAVWNGFVGLSLSPGWYAVFAPAALAFLAGGWIRFRRSDRRFSETALYLGLWCIWPPVCVWIAYLSITIGYPLQDSALAASDAVLGFHWIEVSRFVEAIPWLGAVLDFFYV